MNFSPQAPPVAGMPVQISGAGPMDGSPAVVDHVLPGGGTTIVLVTSDDPAGTPFHVSVGTQYLAPL